MVEAIVRRIGAPLCVAALTVGLFGCPSAVRWGDGPAQTRQPSTPSSTRTSATRRTTPPQTYKVRTGDSLYAIALRYDLSASDLARWNRLGSGELIFAGQVLRLRPDPNAAASPGHTTPSRPSANPNPTAGQGTKPTPQAAAPRFVWPASGAVVSAFSDPVGIGEGIDIKGKIGDPVRASSAGRVVYSGDGLKGYGNLIIVKHNERFLSAYGYNDRLLVKEGDQVSSGQSIAQMGRGPDRKAVLHFEIREHGKPVDPQRFLPRL